MQIADLYVNRLGGTIDDDQFRDEFDFKRPSGPALAGGPETKPPAAPAADDDAAVPMMNQA
jgi:hypothetical protein